MVRLPGSTDERDVSWLDDSGSPVLSPTRGRSCSPKAGGGAERGLGLSPEPRAAANDAVRLGDGSALALSPDGAMGPLEPPERKKFRPAAVGSRAAERDRGRRSGADFPAPASFPTGSASISRPARQDGRFASIRRVFPAATPAAISPEGVEEGAIRLSPDGSTVAAPGPGRVLRPLSNGRDPRRARFTAPRSEKSRSSGARTAGRSGFAVRTSFPSGSYRVDVATGQARRMARSRADGSRRRAGRRLGRHHAGRGARTRTRSFACSRRSTSPRDCVESRGRLRARPLRDSRAHGAGGMGDVYRAKDPRLVRDVAREGATRRSASTTA